MGDNETPLAAALRACRRHFIGAFLFSALLNLLFLAPTLYMLQVYDRVVPTRGQLTLGFLTLALAGALAALSLLDLVRTRLLARASVRLDLLLAGPLLDLTLARTVRGKEVITRQAMRDFDTLRGVLTGPGVLALFDAPWAPIYIGVCFLLHPLLGAMALVGCIALAGMTLLNERATGANNSKATEAANAAYAGQQDTATRAETVRALGMRSALVERHLKERHLASVLQARASFASAGYVAGTKFIRLSLQSLALGLGAWLAVEQKMSAGAIFAASFLVARAMAPLEQILGAWKGLEQARTAWRHLTELMQHGAGEMATAPTKLPAPTGLIEVEAIGVLTPRADGMLLQGVSFAAEAGELIGVIGPSGAGKSTLLRVLAGAAPPDHGHIRFDGAEIRDYDPEQIARHIGYMPQETSLLRGTVKENISRFREGDPDEIDAAVVGAATAAGAHDMIVRLPNGYDTPLGFGGHGLSAGQAQRVALARAFFGGPQVVVLDEPNAFADSDGELALAVALQGLKARGVTVIMAAHRPSILALFSKLLVLRDGRMEMFGEREAVLQRLAPKPQAAAPRVFAPTEFLRRSS